MWNFNSLYKIIWLSLVGVMLAGCSGGGGGTPAPPAPTTTPTLIGSGVVPTLQWNSGNWDEKKWN